MANKIITLDGLTAFKNKADAKYTVLSNGTGTAGLIKTSSTVTSNSGYTACPVISGVPYYKDTNTTYTHPSYSAMTGAPTANATPAFGGTFSVNQICSDSTGHVTTCVNRTITIPNTSASASTAGLIKVSSVNSSAVTVNSETTTAGRYYPVELNSDGKAIVNVPWTDTNTNTTYSAGNGLTLSGTTFTPSLVNTTAASNSASYTAGGSSKFYAVQLDSNKKLGVYVPWTDTNTNTTYSAGSGLSLSGTTINHASSVTAGTVSDGGSTRTLAFGGTFKIPSVTYNATGHITGTSTITLTMPANPNTDTKNTAGSTNSSSKLFLIGATSQAANPQTYSHDTAYVGTDGCLYSGGAKVLTSHQDISGKANLSGATFTGLVKFNETDGSCINFDSEFYINKQGGSTLLGSNGTTCWFGMPSAALTMRGSATRPTYNGNNLALYSDVPTFTYTASTKTLTIS